MTMWIKINVKLVYQLLRIGKRWRIRFTKWLRIRRIQVRKYSKMNDKYTTCAICLCDFEEGYKIRELACGHRTLNFILYHFVVCIARTKHKLTYFYSQVFNIKCINKWLSNSNMLCPVCKQSAFTRRSLDNVEEGESEEEAGGEEHVSQQASEARVAVYSETSRLIDS